MARRVSVCARPSLCSHAESRRARGRGRALPASLRQCCSMRSEPRVASHRDVSAESSLGHQRHSARCAPYQLGQGGRGARLRSGSVRIHRYQPGSARSRRRRSVAEDLRRSSARHPADLPDGQTSPSRGLIGSKLTVSRCPRKFAWRTAIANPVLTTKTARRIRSRSSIRRSSTTPRSWSAKRSTTSRARAVRSSRICRCYGRIRRSSRPSLTTRCTIPRRCRDSRALATAEDESRQHPWLAHQLARRLYRATDNEKRLRRLKAVYYGLMSRVDAELGRLIRFSQGIGTMGFDAHHLYLGPRRADRRSLAHRQMRLFRRLLPHPANRPRSAPASRRRARLDSFGLHRKRRHHADDARSDRRRHSGAMRRCVTRAVSRRRGPPRQMANRSALGVRLPRSRRRLGRARTRHSRCISAR